MDLSILEIGHIRLCKLGCHRKIKNGISNRVDPGETARYEGLMN